MPRGALAAEHEPLGLRELAGEVGHAAEDNPAVALVAPAAQAVAHRVGLLENLLEHVVRVVAEFVLLDGVFEFGDDRRDRHVVDGERAKAIRPQNGHLVVVEVDHAAGVFDNGRGIAGDDVFVLADADDQRRALAGHDQRFRLVLANDGDAVGALDLGECRLDGLLQHALALLHLVLQLAVQVADEDGQDLGVGLAAEGVAVALKVLFEGGVVLDNAVVDQGDAAGAVGVGVGVEAGGGAVGGPAGVGHADARARQFVAVVVAALDLGLQDADAPDGAADVQLVVGVDHGQPGRVVAAVFQPFEPLDQHGLGDFASDVGDDPTHKLLRSVGRAAASPRKGVLSLCAGSPRAARRRGC